MSVTAKERENGKSISSFFALGRELKSAKDKFQTLFNLMPDPAVIVDGKGKFLEISDKAAEVSGYRKEELLGKNFFRTNIVTAGSKVVLIENLVKRMMRLHVAPYEIEVVTKDGRKIPFEVNASSIEYAGKQADLVVFRDISERKELEKKLKAYAEQLEEKVKERTKKLRESEQKSRTLLENLPQKIFFKDKNSVYVSCNENYAQDLKIKADEIAGKTDYDLFPKTLAEKYRADDKRIIESEETEDIEEEYVKGGQKRFVQTTKTSVKDENGKVIGILGIFRDITQRKQIEQSVQESQQKFERLFRNIPDAAAYWDSDFCVLDVNPRFTELFGYSLDEIKGKPTRDLVPNDRLEETTILINKARKGYVNYDTVRTRKDGSLIPVSISVAPIIIEGQLTGFMGLYKDITERKQAEEALLRAKEFSDSLINSMQDGFSVLDTHGVHVNVNPAFCEMTGFSREELIGVGMPHPYWLPEIQEAMERSLQKAIQGELGPPHESTFIRKNGEHFPVILSPSVIKDRLGNVTNVFATVKEVSERKKMEDDLRHYSEHLEELVEERTKELKATQEQLITSEKMAAIGELATMVAHDLRNPLTGIAGATYYLKKKLSSEMDKKAKEMVEIIEKDIKYSNKIITDLLEYSKEIRLELIETDSSSVIREALSMVNVPLNVQVSDFTRNESKIKVDSEKMARVLVNILQNAIDAMPEGGKLTINSWEKEGKLEITVSDTGTGMSTDILEKLWTPFFTTKAKGMGLGLPICKRIVEVHEGNISVESTVGKGTTFTITIPIQLN